MERTMSFSEGVQVYKDIEGRDALYTDSKMTEYILDHCELEFLPENSFFCMPEISWESNLVIFDIINEYRLEKELGCDRELKMEQMMETRAMHMITDFGHTAPNWTEILKLGFSGLKKRAESYAAQQNHDSGQERFYEAVLRCYQASERFIHRVIEFAEKENRGELADTLRNLLVAPPENLSEALTLLLLFYALQHGAECTWIRTFGRVDQILYPFYCKEEKETARQMIRDFLVEINAYDVSANMPFCLGGSDEEGNDQINELSYVFLEEYCKLKPHRVKIHVLCSEQMSGKFMETAMDGVRSGANSLCFFGDTTVKRALRRLGIAEEDITDYHVDGCYECGGFGELTSPATAKINIAKAVEWTLNQGIDVMKGYKLGKKSEKEPETFEAFYQEFLKQLEEICECAKAYVAKMERIYPKLHAGPLFSSTYLHCMEQGKDIFANFGAKYNNTSITACGLGTAVDALMGVKRIVYEDGLMSLSELNNLMKNNWEGQEALRLTAKNKFPKYGMGDPNVDCYAADIVAFLGSRINGSPNAKGGSYRMGLYSITWRWELGEQLAATPDGRLAGETISLNSGATFGADREGVTGHILSMTAVDATNAPTSAVLDLELHASAVRGSNGLKILCTTLKTFLKHGGFAVHYNVLDAESLKRAQKRPEDYPNLQVRVCGWNCLFAWLSKKEQDEYIMRAARE